MYIKAILKNISKNKFKNILNIFQLTISFVAVIVLLGMILNIEYKISSVKEVVGLNTLKGQVDVQALMEAKEPMKDYRFEIIPKSLNEIYNNQFKDLNVEHGRYSISSNMRTNINFISMDQGVKNIVNFEIHNGRMLDKDDFQNLNKNNIIPVVVSYDLKEQYPIGSKFKSMQSQKEITCEVVGILSERSKFWLKDKALVDELKESILRPENIFEDGYFYLCKLDDDNNKNIDKIKSEMIERTNSFNTEEFSIVSTSDTVKGFIISKFKEDILKIFFLAMFVIVLLILVLIGIRSLFKLQILKRKSEFGIHLSLGATGKTIVILVLGEIIFDLIISVLLGLSIFQYLKNNMIDSNAILISFKGYSYALIMLLLITFIPILLSLKKLAKSTPVELIRREL